LLGLTCNTKQKPFQSKSYQISIDSNATAKCSIIQ
jgi:hypothetical protein